MQQFYEDFETLDRFTLSLDYHRDKIECIHCAKRNQFVSHGIIYKQRSMSWREPVGKRIFCSDRHGRSGCGRTFQLYVANEIPSCHYSAARLWAFIAALLARQSVADAYQQATGQTESRHAWRWINRLMRRLTDYRRFLKRPSGSIAPRPRSTTRRLHILLSTLEQLPATPDHCQCSSFQLQRQSAFI